MYNVHLTHSLLCFEFVEFTLNIISTATTDKIEVGRKRYEYALKDLPADRYSDSFGKDSANVAGKHSCHIGRLR